MTRMMLVIVCAASVIAKSHGDAAAAFTSTPVGVEGGTNATPSIAARGERVAVAWAATKNGSTDIYAATSADGGRTFVHPVRVNDVAGAANVSGEQPPRIAFVEHDGPAWVEVMWTAKGSNGTRLLSSRSTDGGASFAGAAVVPGSDAKGNRGWESMAAAAPGAVFRMWLDHRELAETAAASPQGAAPHHDGQAHTGHGDADGVARAQLSKLYFLGAWGAPDQPARAIASGVCYCCKTSLAVAADGAIYAAWRHVYPGNVRDIAFTLSRDGGRTFAPPTRVSNDEWVLDGCPENGPSMAVDASGIVHIVWPTLVKGSSTRADADPMLGLFYATTRDGKTFTPRVRIPTDGTPRHPDVAVNRDGRVLVTWDEQLTGSRRVVIAEAVADESHSVRFNNRAIVDGARNDYPVVAGIDHGFAVAYTSAASTGSMIRVSQVMK